MRYTMEKQDGIEMKTSFIVPKEHIRQLINLALDEDIAGGDVTSDILVPTEHQSKAILLAKAPGVLAGIDVACLVLLRVDPDIQIEVLKPDGAKLKKGDIIARIAGRTRSILKAERVMLNFLQKLSGVATQTSKYVALIKDSSATILDTRKTTPGFRLLEKYAVKMGGGENHRLNLSEGILMKDNHLAILRTRGMTLKEAVKLARQKAHEGLWVEIETTNLKEVKEAVDAGADIIMFDNMSPEMMKQAVKLLPAGIKSEASGGVTTRTLRIIAETGVNYISVGALTHSSKALDISLELVAH